MRTDPENPFFLISGITGSIGSSLASFLCSKNFNVIGLSRNKVSEDHLIKHPKVQWLEYDYAKDEPSEELTETITKLSTKNLISCYHCAGMYSSKKNSNLTNQDFIEVMEGNLISTINFVKLSLDILNPGGSIVILNSQASIAAGNDELAYGVSKRAISSYVDGMQIEATKRNLQIVNVLCGAVQSEMANGRDGFDKFIALSDLSETLYSFATTGSSLRIKNVEILRRNY